MRLALPLLLIASVALPARADDVRESRYGPRSQRVEAAARSTYTGPMLSWAGKVAAPAPESAPVFQPQQAPRAQAARTAPAPQAYPQAAPQTAPQTAPWARDAVSAPPQRPAAAPWARDAVPAPAAYVPPPAPARQPVQAALPTSLYSPPVASAAIAPAAVAAPAARKPWNERTELAGGPPVAVPTPVPTPAAPPVQKVVQAAAAPPVYANARASGSLAPRTYSVGRQFGLTPDRIAAPGPPNTVLMAVDPAAQATAPADLSDGPDHGSADWLAQAAREAGRDAPAKKKTPAEESDL
ncbi:hypothetical protein [Caulobacter hibisci]|uniref:Meckel syndrome type 1 protein n=1 Tax=Caulobacter hibisci TaxID=2035993 RepID=A0ABS0T1X4_9CAUL|nr:hypothetical protein [Caulobacter hibisci]MBI1685870.1 hypothetical protein [Caulobacter hibisci]